jgi:hypothetical protein
MSESIITFFPVGNGGMTLLRLNDTKNTTILIDIDIRDTEASEDDICDVAQELRDRLLTDSDNRPYVDAFIFTHHHDDHILGFQSHFHTGSIEDYEKPEEEEEGKIIIRELWSTPCFWKRASENYPLSDDAKAFNKEMKRRVELFEEYQTIQPEGDRAIIVGEDPDGKTNSLGLITRKIDSVFTKINERNISSKFEGFILGPIKRKEDEEDDDFANKNRQSIILQLTIKESNYNHKILMAGDAECFVWETLWSIHKDSDHLDYDLLLNPHHCSWHSLSYDSQSNSDDPKVCEDAKRALSKSKSGARIIAQCKPIKNNNDDPPSKAAKDEYIEIVTDDNFYCTDEYPPKDRIPQPLEFNLPANGPQKKGIKEKSKLSVAALASTKESYPHG